MLLFLTSVLSTFLAPTVHTHDGQRLTLHGNGPPVLFSSGLFGVMPRRIYTDFIARLSKHLTIVVPTSATLVTATTVDDVADALAVERVGLLTHSSFDAAILASMRVEAAVLCDPVVFPALGVLQGGFVPPLCDPNFAVRVLRAERAYDPATPGIPPLISPRFVAGADVTYRTFDDVGHADLLDDTWADVGRRTIPWMKGLRPRNTTYDAWTFDGRHQAAHLRDAYRAQMADDVIAHLNPASGLVTVL